MIKNTGLPMDFLDGWHLVARLLRSGTPQSIPNAVDTIITYTSELYDQGGMANLGVNNDRVIIRQYGVYDVLGQVNWDGATAVTGDRRTMILVNGVSVWGKRIKALVTAIVGNNPVPVTVTSLALAPNDFVQMSAFQNASGGVSVDASVAVFAIGKCARKAG
jgi:hypothetical protein